MGLPSEKICRTNTKCRLLNQCPSISSGGNEGTLKISSTAAREYCAKAWRFEVKIPAEAMFWELRRADRVWEADCGSLNRIADTLLEPTICAWAERIRTISCRKVIWS